MSVCVVYRDVRERKPVGEQARAPRLRSEHNMQAHSSHHLPQAHEARSVQKSNKAQIQPTACLSITKPTKAQGPQHNGTPSARQALREIPAVTRAFAELQASVGHLNRYGQ